MTQSLQHRLEAIWNNSQPIVKDQLERILSVVTQSQQGSITAAACLAAASEAHRIAGYAGSFGLLGASRLAREIEQMLREAASRSPVVGFDEKRLFELHRRLLTELSKSLPGTVHSVSQPHGGELTLLVVDDDPVFARTIAAEAGVRGVEVAISSCLAEAREAIIRVKPDLIFLDTALKDGEDGLSLLIEPAFSAAPVVVLTSRSDTGVHVRAAELGARGFLDKSKPVSHLLDSGFDQIRKKEEFEFRILAVDDDRIFLSTLQGMLPETIRFIGLSDPSSFWPTLEATQPDLLILDQNMPGFSGTQLCRAVRADAQWTHVPILLLTADTESTTLTDVFSAGADDFIRKPISGVELRARVEGRLERMAWFRRQAERDPLTNLLNRRRAYSALARYISLAKRHETVLAVAMLDLDHFKTVNDTHGHSVGDAVLRRLAELLSLSFRGEDVVARWGGEEFLVAMYGATDGECIRKIEAVLQNLREEKFQGGNDSFHVTFSGGVAQLGCNGEDADSLVAAADTALYRAKIRGRNQVLGVDSSSLEK